MRSADSLRFPRFNMFTALTVTHTMSSFQKIVKAHFGSFTWQHLFMLVQLLVTDAMSCFRISIYRNCHLKQSKRISSMLDRWTRFQVTPLLRGTRVPVGRNTLDKNVNVMCRNAGLEGYKTNHSLRATGATEMY